MFDVFCAILAVVASVVLLLATLPGFITSILIALGIGYVHLFGGRALPI